MKASLRSRGVLLASVVALVLCVSMLLGSTIAWFTDSAHNYKNTITTGELSIQLLKYDDNAGSYQDITNTRATIFNSGITWEPGMTQYVLLQVANAGNLALNYNIIINVDPVFDENGEELDMENVLEYALIDGVDAEAYFAAVENDGFYNWDSVKEYDGAETGAVPLGYTRAAQNGALIKGESDYFLLAIHMKDTADNKYQGRSMSIDVNLEAKQMSHEEDMFGDSYDADSEYATAGVIRYHVSPTGDDKSATGSFEKPFGSLYAAAEKVKNTNHDDVDVEVLIHGGTYLMTKSVDMTGENAGGKNGYTVTYRPAGDGEVEFTGYVTLQTPLSTWVGTSGNAKRLWNQLPEAATDGKHGYIYKLSFFGAAKAAMGDYIVDINGDGDYNYKDVMLTHNKYKETTAKPFIMDYFSLKLNGEEQTIAEWPNHGQYATITDVVSMGRISGYEGDTAVFKYDYENIARWDPVKSLPYAVVRGYLSREYREEWNMLSSIDTVNRTVTLKYATEAGVKGGCNWKIVNLPEELDVPGEYFLDNSWTGCSLYFLSPYMLTEEDKLEFLVSRNTYINVTNTANIIFEGLNFSGFRNDANTKGVININGSDNILVENCMFENIDGAGAITMTGTNLRTNACGFYNSKGPGIILMGGGNTTTLEHQNNIIENCHFYNTGTKNTPGQTAAISANGYNYEGERSVGCIIRNNVAHHSYGNMVMTASGTEMDISYNEISNSLRTLNDYGLIYTGLDPVVQGTEIHHNYLHDFACLTNPDGGAVLGIYIDDYACGLTMYNNIVVAGDQNAKVTGIGTHGGAYNKAYGNILAYTRYGIQFADRSGAPLTGGAGTFVNKIPNLTQTMKDKYPFMMELYNESVEAGKLVQIGNVMENNVAYLAPYNVGYYVDQFRGVFNNNVEAENLEAFVDPVNHDWRLTSEFAAANKLTDYSLTEDNFDMDLIGIQKDVWNVQNPKETFKLRSPVNGSKDLEPNSVVIAWEQALFADEYIYLVARDPYFRDIAVQGTTVFEFAELPNLPDLPDGEKYYWRVIAVSKTKQLAAQWSCENIFSFTTGYQMLSTTKLQWAIEDAQKEFAKITVDMEGSNAGDYFPGTVEVLKAMMDNAYAFLDSVPEKETSANAANWQAQMDDWTTRLNNTAKALAQFQWKGYTSVDTTDISKWGTRTDTTGSSSLPTAATSDGEVITVVDSKPLVYESSYLSCEMMVIDIKPSLNSSANLTSALQILFRGLKVNKSQLYADKGYLLYMKPNGTVELQRRTQIAGSTLTAIVVEKENALDWIYGEWNRIVLKAIDLESGGVRLVFELNGVELINFVDREYPMSAPTSMFAIQQREGLQIRGVDVSDPNLYPLFQ